MSTVQSLLRAGDLLVWAVALEYCCKSAIIRNAAATAVDLENVTGAFVVAGTNGADFNLAVATGEANVVGIILKGDTVGLNLAATTNSTGKYLVLHRGPCIVNQSQLPANDPAGAAWTLATIITALTARGFEFRSEPTKISTHST